MILYFTGTGNSEFVAKRIGEKTGDEILNLFEKIRDGDYSRIKSATPFVFVVPTYAWQIPHIVRDWIRHTKFGGNRKAYFVMTCGDSIGNAGEYIEKLCGKKGFNYMGCAKIIMPENYIAMFQAPERDEALRIIDRALPAIDDVIEVIKKGERIPQKKITVAGKISTALVNKIFYPAFVHAKPFYTTEACIGCGKCETVCPMNNIDIIDGRPVWDDHCTQCMACICGCPEKAIEYGKKSKGKPRYQCPM